MSMLINAHWRVLPPSQGIDKNWHVTDDGDTRVANCFGFAHDIDSGEAIARRICAALNFCRGMPLGQLEGNSK